MLDFAQAVYSELGGGFNEPTNQAALAIEFREAGIPYLKEVNIEIFYKGQCVGTDRPDFILLPHKKPWNLRKPIVLETKVSPKLSDDHHQQLKTYLKSLPQNRNATLTGIDRGILLRFHKAENFRQLVEVRHDRPVELELWRYSATSDTMELMYSAPPEEIDEE